MRRFPLFAVGPRCAAASRVHVPQRFWFVACSFHSSSLVSEEPSRRKQKTFSVDRSALVNHQDFLKSEEEILQGKELPTPLARDLISYIQMRGPITVHDYMAQAANHPLHGYYQSKNEKIGERGDFITAPEMSQLFGEILGVWVQLAWRAMGCPPKVSLVELGPGKGTLMHDILRVGRKYEDFSKAVSVHFVELSRDLRVKQLHMLSAAADAQAVTKIKDLDKHLLDGSIQGSWYSLLHQVPTDVPCIIIGKSLLPKWFGLWIPKLSWL
jgi:hypothetical protein